MFKQKEKNSEKIKEEEIKNSKSSKIEGEIKSFLNASKIYITKSANFYFAVAKKIYRKASDVLSEELGQESADYKKKTRLFILSLFYVLAVFLVSSTPISSETFPLSLALVSSAGSRVLRRSFMTPRVVVGLTFVASILSTLRMGGVGVLYFTALFTIFILRSVVTSGDFNESLVFRTLTAFFSSVIVGAAGMVIGSFSLDSIFSAVSVAVIAPLFAYMFSGFFVTLGEGIVESRMRARAEVGIAAAFFALVLSLSNFSILGFSISAAFAFVVTAVFSKMRGSMHGGVFGMLGGVAAGGGLFSAVFGVVGVVTAVFFSASDVLALTVAVFISSAVSLFVGGLNGLLFTLPEVLFACLAVYPILKIIPVSEEKITLLADSTKTSEKHERENTIKKLDKLSGTFATLSEVFFAVTDTLKTPTLEEVLRTVDNSMNKACATCSMSGMCWSRYYGDTREVRNSVAKRVLENGRINNDDFPEFFTDRCKRVDEICEGVNRRYATVCYALNDSSRANLIAGEYKTVSKLLRDTKEAFERGEKENLELARRAGVAMRSLGIPFGRVEAWGERASVIDVLGLQVEKITASTNEILATFEAECGMLFEEPEIISLATTSALRLKRRRAISLECAKKSVVKKGEKVNGDSVSFFEKEDGSFFALICDGMGSGRSAALTSRLATVFLEKVLTCTEDKKVTLEMLNNLLMTKKDECFTTLDMVEIDLFEKKASFIKAGAAPSFLIREDKIYKINSSTPPAGIIPSLTAEETKVSVKKGDKIIILSDGISDSSEGESTWLLELLDEKRELGAKDLCDTVLSSALSRFEACDDMSIAVIEIFE